MLDVLDRFSRDSTLSQFTNKRLRSFIVKGGAAVIERRRYNSHHSIGSSATLVPLNFTSHTNKDF